MSAPEGLFISLRGQRLPASDAVAAELAAGRGPRTSGGVLAALLIVEVMLFRRWHWMD